MDRRNTEQSVKAYRQRTVDRFATETQRMLARENVFPKRSRWQYAESLSRLTNVFDSLVNIADGIKPTCKVEYEMRHILFTASIVVIKALEAKMSQAMRVLEVPADKFETWTILEKAARSSIYRQINGDKIRYEPEYGPVSIEEDVSSILNALIALLGTRSI